MTVTERHMAPGGATINLAPDMPADVRALLTAEHTVAPGDTTTRPNIGWATLVVTPEDRPVTEIDATTSTAAPFHGLMGDALWSGIAWGVDRGRQPSIEAVGLAAYLGVGDLGDLWVTGAPGPSGARSPLCPVVTSGWGWVDWMVRGGTKLLDHAILGSASVSVTLRSSGLGWLEVAAGAGVPMGWKAGDIATRMDVIQRACQMSGWDWEVTPGGRFRFGAPSNMWPDAQVVVGPGLPDDPSLVVIDGRVDTWESTLDGWVNRAWTTGEFHPSTTLDPYPWGRVSATGTGYRRLDGGEIQWGETIESGDDNREGILEDDSDWLNRSWAHLVNVQSGPWWVRPEISVSGGLARRHGTTRPPRIRPGAEAHVWDPTCMAWDESRSLMVGGQTIHPLLVRIASVEWPILPGYGVYLLRRSGATTWHPPVRLTPWVVPDDDRDNVRIEVGRPAPPLTTSRSNTR